MNRVLKLLIICCFLPTINFGQVSLEKSDSCSSLRAEIPPENIYHEGCILNLELRCSDNSWSKLRRVELNQQSEFEFNNVPSGEYRVTLLRNSKYDVSKFELKNIASAPIILECRERNLNNVLELVIHPNPTNSTLKVDLLEYDESNMTFEILNLSGQLLMRGEYSSSEIDVTTLGEGQFYITILSTKGIVGAGKFVKTKF